jgi:hypothetical protein
VTSRAPDRAPDLEESIDALYRLPLAEFTERRNELAAARKAAGDQEGAARVKAVTKPSAVAWAVNRLYWSDRPAFDRVVQALAEVAAAQQEAGVGGAAGELRRAMQGKSEALAAAARIAARCLVESGGAGGPALLQRLSATLEALASPRPSGDAGPRPGRLEVELRPVGFDLAFGLGSMELPPVPVREAEPSPEVAGPEMSEGEKAAKARISRAETEVLRLAREVEAAVRSLGEAEQRLAAARADAAGLEARLLEARARVEAKAAAEEDARRRLEALRAALSVAEGERSAARAAAR